MINKLYKQTGINKESEQVSWGSGVFSTDARSSELKTKYSNADFQALPDLNDKLVQIILK